MKIQKYLFVILFLQSSFCIAQFSPYQNDKVKENYNQAFSELNNMLNGKSILNFKKAVFISENVYFNNTMNYEAFNSEIEDLSKMINALIKRENLIYAFDDSAKIKKHAAIFTLMKDSIKIYMDSSHFYYHQPFSYDFDDIWGSDDWSKMFVSKLLETGKGNCHSLPFLYKILAQELNEEAYLSFAPNHIYIKIRSKKDGWYNTELTSGYFPIDAWLMASGYIHLSAIQNAIYMDTLSNQQSIAVCLFDLAKGYEKKNIPNNEEFILQCCDTALKYYPNYINALLLKAETKKKIFQAIMQKQNATYPKEVFSNPKAKELFDEMQNLYTSIHKLGYRSMPKEMYLDWLVSLKTEKEKYQNKNITNFTNNKK